MTDENSMAQVITPRSDQINADSLLSGPITITISKVEIKAGTEQPVTIHYDGEDGKPWRPCKSMARILVNAWGADSSKYVGRSLTLYCDPRVKWGGMEVGGIRISHMTDIDSAITMALTVTRANKKPFTVRPLKGTAAAQASPSVAASDSPKGADEPASAAAHITPEQALTLESLCTDNAISIDALKNKAKVERVSMILAADYDRAKAWVNSAIAKRKETEPAV